MSSRCTCTYPGCSCDELGFFYSSDGGQLCGECHRGLHVLRNGLCKCTIDGCPCRSNPQPLSEFIDGSWSRSDGRNCWRYCDQGLHWKCGVNGCQVRVLKGGYCGIHDPNPHRSTSYDKSPYHREIGEHG